MCNLTRKDAKIVVKGYDSRLTLTYDANYQEYCVKVKGSPNADYFTNDRMDAVNTAYQMALAFTHRQHDKA